MTSTTTTSVAPNAVSLPYKSPSRPALSSRSFSLRQPPSSGMPYTPPSHRSPASSATSSPTSSRRPSFHGSVGSPTRQSLPRSASYTAKHRRTPSISGSPASPTGDASTPDITPPGTSDDLKGMLATHASPIRQSPPPVSDSRAMPPGAILSPPESSSEDEGLPDIQKRGRDIENLDELKEAISALPQHRQSSPSRKPSPGDLLVLPSQVTPSRLTDGPPKSSLANSRLPNLDTRPPTVGRKVSHTRSATEPSIFVSKSEPDFAVVISDNSEGDEDQMRKPHMVRKKSGELVRPALRPASHRRPSSMPGTPIYYKAVHFDSHLEHVRHFLQVDRPLAVSATTSPNQDYESDAEYPFNSGDKAGARPASPQWEINVRNFPVETPLRKGLPARLERVWLSGDHKSLIGSVVVANLAFQKSVVCRFTFDYWKTVSELAAEYSQEVSSSGSEAGQDRFQFGIKLSDIASLESKTLFFCVRYSVNGIEYWDNNDNANFQVDFCKRSPNQSARRNSIGTSSRSSNALPRSNRRGSGVPRPKSMPAGAFDEFGHGSADLASLNQPIHDFLGEPGLPIRLKSNKSSSSLPSDNLSSGLPAPSGQAFGSRYDFGASLNATVRGTKEPTKPDHNSDALYMKPNKRATFSPAAIEIDSQPAQKSKLSSVVTQAEPPKSQPTQSGVDSPSATIASASYEEILSKYCFFGSKQSSPQFSDKPAKAGHSGDVNTHVSNSPNSSGSGSPEMRHDTQQEIMHQSLRQNLNPYFQNMHLSAKGASPVESPLQVPPSMVHQSLNGVTAGSPAPLSDSSSPMAGFAPLSAMSPSEYFAGSPSYQSSHSPDRSPFAQEAQSWTAIRG